MRNLTRSGCVLLDGDRMHYVEFGRGERLLVMIPGLGDGFAPVTSTIQALGLTFSYRQLAKDFHVYLFSRKNNLPQGCTTRDMARDLANAMQSLGISQADILGVSQGGMIAQYLAIDFPELVHKLVLTVSSPGPNEMIDQTVNHWMALAEQGKFKELMVDTAEKSYSDDYLLKYRLIYPFLGLAKPRSFHRFLIQAESCLSHSASWELGKILCPTLIIGGGQDRIVGVNAAPELAEKIKGSELYVYKGLGHALYEEAPDFQMRIAKYFLR